MRFSWLARRADDSFGAQLLHRIASEESSEDSRHQTFSHGTNSSRSARKIARNVSMF